MAGVTSDMYGWRSFWWISTAVSAFTNIWIFFFLPETKWDRRNVAAVQTASEVEVSQDNNMAEKSSAPIQIEEIPINHDPAIESTNLGVKLSGRPNKKQFLPMRAWHANEPILDAIILPFKLVRFPIVLWASFQFAFSGSCFLMRTARIVSLVPRVSLHAWYCQSRQLDWSRCCRQ